MIQNDLTSFFKDTQPFTPSVHQSFNLIHQNRIDYISLYKWLFDTPDFKINQVKFANYLGGSDYEFETPEYNYSAKSGQVIGFNPMTKQFTIGIRADFIKYNLTRDDILDSPFDINKLIEVPYNGEEENAD